MAAGGHKYQPPKGTRDFYPLDMAVRRHLERLWRDVSIRHGFDEVDGPTYEHLELYTVKSGPGIVSELFSFRRSGGDTDYALRPEFTPTLARMVAARGSQIPKPIRWFSLPSMFRAERPQRGRLREHIQWNLDILGDDSPGADADLIALAVDFLATAGLGPDDVTIRISHRDVVSRLFEGVGVAEAQRAAAFELLDRRDKVPPEVFNEKAHGLGLDADAVAKLDRLARTACPAATEVASLAGTLELPVDSLEALGSLQAELAGAQLLDWCRWDMGIVRGLAYYTGIVFEVHEASGKERAIAGGGRYDQLVALFDGPPTPAVGFAMGDVVIRLVLEERGLLQSAEAYMPRPDAFVISAGDEAAEGALRPLVARLRRAGLHVRTTGRSTRNVKKLLGEAGRTRARRAVILGRELAEGQVQIKDLDSGEQMSIALDDLESCLRGALTVELIIVTAVAAEADAIGTVPGARVVVAGLGRTNAAAATTQAILGAQGTPTVLSAGVAGALPGSSHAVGSVIAASACIYAEEGLVTPEGFLDVTGLGFALGDFEGNAVPVDPRVLESLEPVFPTGPVATVATCSGTDAAAAEVARRTGAVVEAMEGAAVVHAARRLGAPAGELRVISNTTGNRDEQRWDLRGALTALGPAVRRAASLIGSA